MRVCVDVRVCVYLSVRPTLVCAQRGAEWETVRSLCEYTLINVHVRECLRLRDHAAFAHLSH